MSNWISKCPVLTILWKLSHLEGLGKKERTEGQQSFHTVGGSADYANVQQHIVNQCSLLHQDHDCPRAWHMLELIYVTEGHWYVELWWHDFKLEFCLLKRVVCICNSAYFLWYWIAVNMIIVLDIHHNHQVLWNKMIRKFSLFLKTLWMKTSYDLKCPKSWSFYDYTYYDAYFKVMYVLQRTKFSSFLSVHKTGAHHPSTAMFQ